MLNLVLNMFKVYNKDSKIVTNDSINKHNPAFCLQLRRCNIWWVLRAETSNQYQRQRQKERYCNVSFITLMLLPLSGTNIKKQERKVLPASLFEIHFNPGCGILCPPFTISAINEVSNRFQTITGCNISTARQQNRTSGIN